MIRFLLNLTIVACGVVSFIGSNRPAGAQLFVELSEQGELTIVGDNNPSAVYIRVDDQLTITSQTLSYSFETSEITNVNIQLGKDIDQVTMDLFHPLLADVSISTGQARDNVVLRDHEAGGGEYSNIIVGNVSINTGHGDDYVLIAGVAVAGNVDISTGNGRDFVELNTPSDLPAIGGSNDIWGNVSINTGVDSDIVSFGRYDTNVEQDLMLELGQGDDIVFGTSFRVNLTGGSAFLSGGQGTDTCPDDLINAPEIIKIGFEN